MLAKMRRVTFQFLFYKVAQRWEGSKRVEAMCFTTACERKRHTLWRQKGSLWSIGEEVKGSSYFCTKNRPTWAWFWGPNSPPGKPKTRPGKGTL